MKKILSLDLRRLLLRSVFLIAFVIGGCAQIQSTLEPIREHPTLQNAARGVLIGKLYDRAAIAQRNRNTARLQETVRELEKLDPLAAAEQFVSAGLQLDSRAMKAAPSQRQKLAAESEEKYREALRISPQFPSKNATLLNALGYFLADRGKSQQEFQQAKQLTSEAIRIWDQAIEEVEDAPLSGPLVAARRYMRAITRDSHAWALFRLGEYEAARSEQLDSIQETQETAETVKAEVPADLYFHLGEIERALGNIEEAKTQYHQALQIEPDHQPSHDALRVLSEPVRHPHKPQTPAENHTDQTAYFHGYTRVL